ncbi:MAG: ATP-dependent helicase C-terminal domain-containing protein [Tepidisphaeraceae bacterium]
MTPLPIDPHLPAIVDAVRAHGSAIIVAEPGAGKTTRVPPAILDSGLLAGENHRLVMLQPRRVAARAAAARIADERRVPLGGDDVGYHVRFDRKLTDRTRLRVLTEGILTRQLVADPFLTGIGGVILDEFHERSLDVDMALSMLREIRSSVRDDLKLIVISATLDAERVATALGDVPIVRVPGRTFPVSVEHRLPSTLKVWERVASEVDAIFTSPLKGGAGGDVLVFLPGVEEIRRSARALEAIAHRHDLDVRILHGSLAFDEQQRALEPTRDGRPRAILSTNIAETSLTIDGVTVVIDSGLARVPRFDPKRGLDRLDLSRISKASAAQRAGRAGRTAPGRCIRLWTVQEQAALREFEEPEVRRVDLAPTVLSLRAWGTADPRTFGWYEAPDEATLATSETLLAMLGAIESERGPITELGKRLARLPVHPRIGRLLLAGVDAGADQLAATVAAILSEKDFVRRESASYHDRSARTRTTSDLFERLELLERGHEHRDDIDRNGRRSVLRVRDELLRVTRGLHAHGPPPLEGGARGGGADQRERSRDRLASPTSVLLGGHELLRKLALLAYPDRVCRRREADPSAATMVGGGGVRLAPESGVREPPLFVALDARSDARAGKREATVHIASGIEEAWLDELFPSQVKRGTTLIYDAETRRVIAARRVTYRDLVLREARESGGSVDATLAGPILARGLLPEARDLLACDDQARSMLARLAFLRKHVPEKPWPDLSDEATLIDLLESACAGKRSASDVRLGDAVASLLAYPLDRELASLAPTSIEVPTGSNITLDYDVPTAPVLAVRLQELFGLTETPRIAGGRVPVVLHLLGPNYRPVQVTDDLASFWKNTYPQVRKDLRARYPKHSWPDDPTIADPIRGARRRRS